MPALLWTHALPTCLDILTHLTSPHLTSHHSHHVSRALSLSRLAVNPVASAITFPPPFLLCARFLPPPAPSTQYSTTSTCSPTATPRGRPGLRRHDSFPIATPSARPSKLFLGSIRTIAGNMSDKAEDSTPAEAQITFKVKASGDKNHQITMAEAATVGELKTKLATEQYENIPVERQRLIYSGRVMKNEDTLASYKVKPGNTIHLVKSAASNPAPAPSASSSSPVPQAVPSNMAAGTSANNLLAGLTGARFAGHANLPSANMFGADGGVRILPPLPPPPTQPTVPSPC